MIKHTPATPLPVEIEEGNDTCLVFSDGTCADISFFNSEDGKKQVAYLKHAANAYPKLVSALKRIYADAKAAEHDGWISAAGAAAKDALVELGEDA